MSKLNSNETRINEESENDSIISKNLHIEEQNNNNNNNQ
jgi:hypothetical protein